MRRPGIELGETFLLASLRGLRLACSIPWRMLRTLFVAECADRELNPGRELGKLESYHWTIGALAVDYR